MVPTPGKNMCQNGNLHPQLVTRVEHKKSLKPPPSMCIFSNRPPLLEVSNLMMCPRYTGIDVCWPFRMYLTTVKTLGSGTCPFHQIYLQYLHTYLYAEYIDVTLTLTNINIFIMYIHTSYWLVINAMFGADVKLKKMRTKPPPSCTYIYHPKSRFR